MLKNIKVVEFATYVAGPSAAAVLAEWGADVIKVERGAGDPTRGLFASQPEHKINPVFEFENRGKRGIVLDVMQPEGRDALLKILEGADIFVTNLRQRTLAKAQLDYPSILGFLPRLIYCSITGYGSQGEAADWPAFDIAATWTRSGMAGLTIPDGSAPFPCRPGMGDAICALSATSAVLAALVQRGRTGKGQLVETSLIRAGVYAMGWDLSIQLAHGTSTRSRQRHESITPLNNYYRTADDHWLCILSRGPGDWSQIAAALDLENLIADERFASPEARLENASLLIAALDVAFERLPLDEIAERLSIRDIIFAPLQSAADLVKDKLAHEAGCFVDVVNMDGFSFRAPAMPAAFPDAGINPPSSAPKLGQHTIEVLAEAGYPSSEIDTLIRSGAAGV